jgi:hypothetical protein
VAAAVDTSAAEADTSVEVRILGAAPVLAVERGILAAAHASAVEVLVFIPEVRAFPHSECVNLK